MRRFFLLVSCAAALLAARPASAEVFVGASVTVGQPVETVTFRERLTPYGHWVTTSYGEAWVPGGVAVGWRPYSDGRWVLTEYGWTFVSDDPWGWATWHYGNWVQAGGVGWVWVPGRTWAPAWVSWRYGGGYAAWAPLPPYGYRVSYGYSSPAWVVVQEQHFTQPIARVAVGVNMGSVYVARAQPLAAPVSSGNVFVNPGPRPQAVSSAVGRQIQPVAANAVVGRGTAAIASAPRAPPAPAPVAKALQQHWQGQAKAQQRSALATPRASVRPQSPPAQGPRANQGPQRRNRQLAQAPRKQAPRPPPPPAPRGRGSRQHR